MVHSTRGEVLSWWFFCQCAESVWRKRRYVALWKESSVAYASRAGEPRPSNRVSVFHSFARDFVRLVCPTWARVRTRKNLLETAGSRIRCQNWACTVIDTRFSATSLVNVLRACMTPYQPT